MIKEIQGHRVDEKFLYPKATRIEFDRGLSWKPIETPNQYPKYIIEHFTCSYKLEDTVGYFQNEGVSVHFVVGKKGEIVQMAPCNMRCAHAGSSTWNGDEDLNRFSIGIEVVCLGPLELRNGKFYDCWNREYNGPVRKKSEIGFDYWEPWTKEQEMAVADLVVWICNSFGVSPADVADHAEVAPKRKNDPGASSEMTGPEFREWLKKRISGIEPGYPEPTEPVVKFSRIHIIGKRTAIQMLDYITKKAHDDDLIWMDTEANSKCVICGLESKGNMICDTCHQVFKDKIVTEGI